MSQYRQMTKTFASAVAELHQKMGTSSKPEYERLQRFSEEARAKSDQARNAIEEHIAAHGC